MIKKLFNKSSQKGFTLFDILVSIVIFIIISVLVISNFKYKSPRGALSNGIEQLVTYYRQAQTATFAGIRVGSISPTYGIYLSTITPNQLIIFADTNLNNNYDDGTDEISPSQCYHCGTFSLPVDIEISDIAVNAVSRADLAVVFSATNTEEIYYSGAQAVNDASITLTNSKTLTNQAVTIYYSNGQISR